MLFQLLLNIILFFVKFVVGVLVALVAVPYGILMLLHNMFPVFTQEASGWFWAVFSVCTILAYIVLWKPILWIVGAVNVLKIGV